MKEQDYIDIEAWLHGELAAERTASFQRRVAEDPEFAKALAEREELNGHLKATVGEADFREMLASVVEEKAGSAKVVRMEPRPRNGRWMQILAAAATVLLLVLAFQFFGDGGGTGLDQFAEHTPLALVERGTGTSLAREAETTFNSGQYADAIQPLRDYLAEQDSNVQAQLALGIALMETDRTKEAIKIFTELSRGESALAGYGTWYLALISVRKGDNAAALRYLDQIPPGDDYLIEKARRLRESL